MLVLACISDIDEPAIANAAIWRLKSAFESECALSAHSRQQYFCPRRLGVKVVSHRKQFCGLNANDAP
jgi:hypothetical protein